MPLNLITEPWIPVRTTSGSQVIRPDQIAEVGILAPDWPRADLNIACLEMLVGLVALADPPSDAEDWEERQVPDPARLRERLASLAPAFELDGEGPRFLQDLEPLAGDAIPPDMLFIDSAGANAARNNADVLVRRDRYPALDLSLAAMALYTLQAFAPTGGAGNRTSMRGGGPLVTLVDPSGAIGEDNLWDLVWANVPDGRPVGPEGLPWMQPTRVSDRPGSETWPEQAPPALAFWGMPRRLRLVVDEGQVIGVVQKPWGTNYAGWRHPLTPYYRKKAGAELLPQHPRAGAFGYRHWLGTLVARKGELRERAQALDDYEVRKPGDRHATVLVAGWAMDNMKPRDFTLSRQPFVTLPDAAMQMLLGMLEAAELFRQCLRSALKPVLAEGTALEATVEDFFLQTQGAFDHGLGQLQQGRAPGEVAARWRNDLMRVALKLFDDAALPGLADREPEDVAKIVTARSGLLANFAGRIRPGRDAFTKLGLAPMTKTVESA
ncbi:type I-E CRISPR-associated protein Cse1/CasA [Rubellimicrobium roseum]|uniref:Type I-E CRISPR-associated protein Cse1/CasA n=1 Tax=Rubellimicrobium roseum TaxID=687525 RepID=A0A5C4NF97_9RHOB|nr:type I-E CRISPR-associated protein Cse1/CasA [Rubellimicrobium roseum]TNC72038.1 type I-E CRISPR-associated protein Cse1/CasA [Rubellimicrobium roseum]